MTSVDPIARLKPSHCVMAVASPVTRREFEAHIVQDRGGGLGFAAQVVGRALGDFREATATETRAYGGAVGRKFDQARKAFVSQGVRVEHGVTLSDFGHLLRARPA